MTLPVLRLRESLLVFVLLGLVIGCARHPTFVTKDVTLPSGERVSILDEHGDTFVDVNGTKRHIYYVSYETQHDMNDTQSLREEALRVWAAYEPQVMGSDYDSCVITPIRKTSGGSEAGHPFYFTRRADGSWAPQN